MSRLFATIKIPFYVAAWNFKHEIPYFTKTPYARNFTN